MYIKHFNIKNFKALKGEQNFNFRPITIITGKNSSGKSSLIKSMILLRETIKKSKNLEYLSISDSDLRLGDFSTIINNETEESIIEFKLPLYLDYTNEEFELLLIYEAEEKSFEVFAKLKEVKIISKTGILLFNYWAELKNNEENARRLKDFHLKYDQDFSLTDQEFQKAYTDFFNDSGNRRYKFYYSNFQHFIDILEESIKEYAHQKDETEETEDENLLSPVSKEDYNELYNTNIFDQFDYHLKETINQDDLDDMDELTNYVKIYEGIKINKGIWKTIETNYERELPINQTHLFSSDKKILFKPEFAITDYKTGFYNTIQELELPIQDSIIEKLIDLYGYEELVTEYTPMARFAFELLFKANLLDSLNRLYKSFTKINYLSPFRGITERIHLTYGNRGDFSSSLNTFCSQNLTKKEKLFVKKWLQKFEIGEDIELVRHQGAATSIYIRKNNNNILLADLGYGYHQLLPILIQIIINKRQAVEDPILGLIEGSVIIVEEPESNLHPNLQSLIADFLIDAGAEFNIQFILETHSEYLVRKIQYLIAKNALRESDANIYYFENFSTKKLDKIQSRGVYEISFKKDGSLSKEFGPGFYDEADNLAINLFNLKNMDN